MDEATSSVDAETDDKIQRALRSPAFATEHGDKCTILTVAHRIRTILDYDVVMVVDAGNIVELGRPEELLKIQGGHFARLAKGDQEAVHGDSEIEVASASPH